MIEIGSEYHLYQNQICNSNSIYDYLIENKHEYFFYSGRTVIDLIIRNHSNIKEVYLPNYLCQSIIDPFIKNGVKISFYEISFNNNKFYCTLNDNIDNCFVLGINYFSSSFSKMDSIYASLKKKSNNVIIIDDATHNLFSLSQSKHIDYQFCSIRKWFPVITGASLKVNNSPIKLEALNSNLKIYDTKYRAMTLKANYLKSNNKKLKEQYLDLFKQFNNEFNNYYINRGIDDYSIKVLKTIQKEEYCKRRIENSSYLIKEIINIKDIQTLLYFEKDVPLFVPIFLNDSIIRDKIKEVMIQNKIYCPMHWPVPNIDQFRKSQSLYSNEISLICDQRYNLTHMKKIIEVLKENLDE
ncbi:hypothetical protein [Macrococcus armenti]|uniref:hypothetical protein n=1 Tax=Macrococcus armenti TaxID=2875764 RepID=UPI001CCBEE8F|nr:hypothetical protein [Macrococcus armenti]UBH16124.1 hypothetical protein LAU44_04015 [Macrococcus armenti]UBH18484.1 hypothetical protein LAU39_04025 [Macrococcus armenti]UBH20751.1 hypothetical protein LAU40_04015 [Macrococcus armenti]